jgi:polypeptide N-acetylgalactosaminyltransferase
VTFLFHLQVGDTKNRYFGDISERVAIREKLNCKSFRWFIENVHPKMEIPEKLRDKVEDKKN